MWLSDIAIRRPVFAAVLSLLLVAFGILSFGRLPLRELPDVDNPVVSVDVDYPGASQQVVETKVTQVLEDQLSGLEGIKTIESSSRPGRSSIDVEFRLNRNLDDAANDVRSAVSRVQARLPQDADPPRISKANNDAQPIMWLNLSSSTLDRFELTEYAERTLVDRMSAIDGVAAVRVGGEKLYAMRISLDPKALAARGLTVSDVETAIQRENVELPAGSIEGQDTDISVRLNRAYRTPQDFRQLVIGKGDDGYLIRLGDVAKVALGAQDLHNEFRGNGVPQISLGVIKQSRANTLAVAKTVQREVKRIQPSLPPGTKMSVTVDNSQFISHAIHEVYATLLIAMGLVILVIFLFLGSARAALIPAVTVPVSITAAFIALAAFGLSINLLTLLALVLAIGLVVDDAIVVLENVQRRLDEGEPLLLAAQNGVRQVAFAVIATTVVLISVFTPIAFLQDAVGRLFAELAIALASAVAFSGFVALTLSPMMCSKLLKPRTSETKLARALGGALDKATQVYLDMVRSALTMRMTVLVVFGLIVAAAFVLFSVLPRELAPSEDRGVFMVQVQTPPGSSFQYTYDQMLKVEKVLMGFVHRGVVKRILVRAPAGWGATGSYNTGMAFVVLQDWSKRKESGAQVVNEVRQALAPIPSVKAAAFMPQALGGGGGGRPVQFVLQGPTYEDLAAWSKIIMADATKSGLLLNVDSDYEENTPELRVALDRDRAASMGVSVQEVGNTLQTLLGGKRIGEFPFRGEERDVIAQAAGVDRASVQDLSDYYVRSNKGDLVPLANVVHWTRDGTAQTLNRYNRMRAITISAELAPGVSLGKALDFLVSSVKRDLPPAAQYDFAGQSSEFRDSQSSFLGTFSLALLVVFLVLAAQFESFRHPFIVMLTVPLAITGALFGLLMTNGTLNIYSEVGIIILIGIAAKNGILLVEFANQQRDAGLPIRDAIIEASRTRFRPILMTAISTAMGAVPLAFAEGPGSAARQTIGIVVFSGVIFATALTLIVIPVVYDLLARGTRSPKAIASELAELEARHTHGSAISPAE